MGVYTDGFVDPKSLPFVLWLSYPYQQPSLHIKIKAMKALIFMQIG